MGGVLRFTMGLTVFSRWQWAGCWAKRCTKGALLGLGKRQRRLEYVLFHCLSFLSICVEGNGGFIAIWNGAVGVVQTVTGGMLGQAMRQKAHRLALADANARLNFFSFFVLIF